MDDVTASPELSNSMGDSQLSGFSDGLSGGGASSNKPSTLGSASIDKPLSELLADSSEAPSTDTTSLSDSSSSEAPPVSIPSIPSASGGETEFYEPKDAVGATLISSPEDEIKIDEASKPATSVEPERSKRPGFFTLFLHSFLLFFKHIHQYLLLTFLLVVPVATLFTVSYFLMSGEEVQAKPSLPVITTEVGVAGDLPEIISQEKNLESIIHPNGHSFKSVFLDFSSSIISGFSDKKDFSAGLLIGILIIFILIISFYYFFVRMALARLTFFIDKKVRFSYREIVKWSFNTFGTYVAFLIRLFFYLWAWVPLSLLILYYALHRFNIEILTTIRSLYALDIVFPILIVISVVLMSIRVFRSVFGLYSLADSDKPIRSGAALEFTVDLTRGRCFSIAFYLLLFSLFLFIVSWGLYSLLKMTPTLNIPVLIILIFLFYIGIVFMTLFYRSLKLFPLELKDEKKSSK